MAETETYEDRCARLMAEADLRADRAVEQFEKAVQHAGHQEEPGEVCRADCSGCLDPVGSIVRDLRETRERLRKISSLLYRMAAHINNKDGIAPLKWGVKGLDLLAELRPLDPAKYDEEVKGGRHG